MLQQAAMSRLQQPPSRWLHINRSYPIPLCSAMHQEYLQTAAHPTIPLHVLSLPSKLKSYSHAKPVSKYSPRSCNIRLVRPKTSVRAPASLSICTLPHRRFGTHNVSCSETFMRWIPKFPAHPPVTQHLLPPSHSFAVPACFIIRFERAEAASDILSSSILAPASSSLRG